MPHHSTEFVLGFMDLWTLLFQRKTCGECGSTLVRRAVKESAGPKWQWERGWLALNVWYGTRTRVKLSYACEPCHITYSLSQLRLGEPGDPTRETVERADW
jgi:hypothetical protein